MNIPASNYISISIAGRNTYFHRTEASLSVIIL